ncbi:MAG: hypothetical protein AABW92_03760, partial [Nanoarchaeota archaeon]
GSSLPVAQQPIAGLEQALLYAPTRIGSKQADYNLDACGCPCLCGESSVQNLAVGLPLHGTVNVGTSIARVC